MERSPNWSGPQWTRTTSLRVVPGLNGIGANPRTSTTWRGVISSPARPRRQSASESSYGMA